MPARTENAGISTGPALPVATTRPRQTAWPVRTLRKHPYLYSAVCKARLAYSRRIAAARERSLYRQDPAQWAMTPWETSHCERLKTQGFALIENLVPASVVDTIYARAD